MKVLVACEYSGVVRDSFTNLGHDAWSCDILPTETKGNHIQDDVLKHLDKGWDLLIATHHALIYQGQGQGGYIQKQDS